MFNAVRLAGLIFAVLLSSDVHAADASPRIHVHAVAQAIEAHYFDVARGKQIADDLRAEAKRGDFDDLRDERDLAAALSERLYRLDHHFRVTWTAPAPRPQPAAAPRRGPDPDFERRGNYGVHGVEVLPGNLGYIDLRMFADFSFDKPDEPARRAIEAALQLVAHTDALIIDLRDNGGGSPAMVGYLTSAFTRKGADIYNTFYDRSGTKSEAPGDWYPAPRLELPLYVLTSGGTASAAEAFAYTVQSAKRATLVGENTAGAANPGEEVDAGHGFRVFVSTGSPMNPITKRNWEGTGVVPDIAVDQARALQTASVRALETVLKQRQTQDTVSARWALDALRAQATPPQAIRHADYSGEYGPIVVEADAERLLLRNRRRPPMALLPLGEDLFTVAAKPDRRIRFKRDTSGKATALEMLTSDGRSTRFRREDEGADKRRR